MIMNLLKLSLTLVIIFTAVGCGPADGPDAIKDDMHDSAEPEKGTHGGRLLTDGDLALELAIFEAGVPPEFRVWTTDGEEAVKPDLVDLDVTLTRLGDARDEIGFIPEGDYLRGDTVIYEPHSFVVAVNASYRGNTYQWRYDNFEGRTQIRDEIADTAGIKTAIAGPAVIRDYVTVYGRVVSDPENVSHVNARFDGVIRSVSASIGSTVKQGQVLARIEANDSLNSYVINAPIGGTVIERHANPGETTDGRTLFTIVDTSSVWAELAIFPSDRTKVRVGLPVSMQTAIGDIRIGGEIALLSPVAGANQSVTARIRLDNQQGLLAAGMYLTGEIEVEQFDVPLAVRRTALQSFRDFTVVFAKVDDQYEVRMLELGRQDDEWVEVLGGLNVSTEYVTTNSYVLKADIEKSGASHDH
jgi:cobalt-zinc-cadmium efflux system membrane fusion protein